ncbi:unnamed protein product [Ectocarpus sp. 13 AM-2016]
MDGISARVQLAPTLANLEVYVDPRRLSEGHAPGILVESVCLDPSKGVVVMLTSDHGYTSQMVESRLGKAGGTGGDGRAETAHLRKYDEHKAQLCLADEELRPALRLHGIH